MVVSLGMASTGQLMLALWRWTPLHFTTKAVCSHCFLKLFLSSSLTLWHTNSLSQTLFILCLRDYLFYLLNRFFFFHHLGLKNNSFILMQKKNYFILTHVEPNLFSLCKNLAWTLGYLL